MCERERERERERDLVSNESGIFISRPEFNNTNNPDVVPDDNPNNPGKREASQLDNYMSVYGDTDGSPNNPNSPNTHDAGSHILHSNNSNSPHNPYDDETSVFLTPTTPNNPNNSNSPIKTPSLFTSPKVTNDYHNHSHEDEHDTLSNNPNNPPSDPNNGSTDYSPERGREEERKVKGPHYITRDTSVSYPVPLGIPFFLSFFSVFL